jgi:hypothetical protein
MTSSADRGTGQEIAPADAGNRRDLADTPPLNRDDQKHRRVADNGIRTPAAHRKTWAVSSLKSQANHRAGPVIPFHNASDSSELALRSEPGKYRRLRIEAMDYCS